MAFRSLINWWRTPSARWALLGLGVVGVGFLFYRYMVHDGDFDVYWAATFRYMHGLKIHVYEQNVFTYPTFASFLLLPVYPLGYSAGKIIFFVMNVVMLIVGVIICQRQIVGNSPAKTAALVVALFFSFRSILDVFNNQQTDILIFGLVIIGLAFFTRVPVLGSAVMAIAAGLKANPLFMVLLPIFKKRWSAAIVFILVTVGLVIAPDLAKYSVSDLWTDSEFTVPGSVMPKRDEIPQGTFRAEARDSDTWGYLKEHYQMTLSTSLDEVRWWQDRGSAGNQSLYRIVASHLGRAVPSNFVLLGLCAAFGVALLLVTRRRGEAVFVLGLLFYGAFVLIGPQSSKAHFIAFFGLLLFAWHDALANNSWLKSILLAVLSGLFGIKAAGLLVPVGWISRDIVGLSALGIWLYAYLLLLISGHRR
ncbi:MAG: glycosyltransferase 87 family protein [Arenicellales bacterium]